MKISKLPFKLEFDQDHDLEHMLLLKVGIDEMQVNILNFIHTYISYKSTELTFMKYPDSDTRLGIIKVSIHASFVFVFCFFFWTQA